MVKNFDELFDEFFNGDDEKKSQILKTLIQDLTNLQASEDTNNSSLEEELGEPDFIEEVVKDGFLFKKFIWNKPTGQITKMVITDLLEEDKSNLIGSVKKKSKTLEEQLNEAVDAEDYILAAKLRDEIKNQK